MLTIFYFGRLSDRAARRQETIALPRTVDTLSALKTWLDDAHGLDGALDEPSIKTMINQVVIHDDLTLTGDEEIGFLPPVGGG